jgi:hypothetical protein
MVAQFIQRAPQRSHTATPLLAFLAGDFADAIARVWAAPHGDFFALPAARRHAAALLVSGRAARELAPSELRRLVEFQRDALVAEAIAGANATGVMRALSKAGEQLWRIADYAMFIDLLAEPMANEVLRHLDEVRPASFAPIAALPPALRMAPVVRVIPSAHAAYDLARAFRIAVRMRTPDAATRLARRWGAGGSVTDVFRRAQEDLTPDAFRPADPAPALPAPFARITTRKQLETMALEFRNCLADHAQRIAEGRMAVYIWQGHVPAAIALNWDVAGWRLSEAKAADNVDLEEARLRELVRFLDGFHVRTGPSVQSLASRLDDWASGTSYNHPLGLGFTEQLALGDIWS